MKRSRLTVFSKLMIAKANKFTFAQVEIDGTTLYYDVFEDGADIWILDAEGNPVMPENGEYEIEGTLVDIVDGKIVFKQAATTENMNEAGQENEETEKFDLTEDAAFINLVQLVDTLAKEVEQLKAVIEKPMTDPIEVEKFSKSVKGKKFDLKKFGL